MTFQKRGQCEPGREARLDDLAEGYGNECSLMIATRAPSDTTSHIHEFRAISSENEEFDSSRTSS
jgi:hypothetical protein